MDTQPSLFSGGPRSGKPTSQAAAQPATQAKPDEPSRKDEIQAIVDKAVGESRTRSELAEALTKMIEAHGVMPDPIPLPEPKPGESDINLLARALDPKAFVSNQPGFKQHRLNVLRRAADLKFLLRSTGWTPPDERSIKPFTKDGVTSYPLCTLADIVRIVPPEKVNQCLEDVTKAMDAVRGLSGLGMKGEPAQPAYFVWTDKGEERVRVSLHTAFGPTVVRVTPNDAPSPSKKSDEVVENAEDDPGPSPG